MDYRSFVQSMLQRAKINQEYRDIFTDEKGMKIFLAVVTHPTFDAENNYQELEFIGDGIIKGVLSQYIPRRFPKSSMGSSGKQTKEGTLSKIRRSLEQRKTLSDFALNLGFWNYVRADSETLTKLRKETLEDVFEAFVGALVEIIDERIKKGLGYYYAYNFLEASLDEIEIEIDATTLDDSITRLNELYKAGEMIGGKKPLKWGDAIYFRQQLYVPKYNSLAEVPNPKTVQEGELIYSEKDRAAFVATKSAWAPVNKLRIIALRVPAYTPPSPEEIAELSPTELAKLPQPMWFAGVYGFLNAGDITINNSNKQDVLNNPEKYGATVIGQGLAFLFKDAKKIAASHALNYLESLGYTKAPNTQKKLLGK